MNGLDPEEVWRRFENSLRSFFALRLADSNAVDDLTQETFLRMHAGLPGLKQEERVAAWLGRVARNALTDHLRGRAGDVVPSGDAVQEIAREDSGCEVQDGAEREVASWLEPMLADLDPPQREAVRACDLEGRSAAAVARELGVPPTTVRSRLAAGRRSLRGRLAVCCAFEFDRRGGITAWERRGRTDCCSNEDAE